MQWKKESNFTMVFRVQRDFITKITFCFDSNWFILMKFVACAQFRVSDKPPQVDFKYKVVFRVVWNWKIWLQTTSLSYSKTKAMLDWISNMDISNNLVVFNSISRLCMKFKRQQWVSVQTIALCILKTIII